jgi:hypothetical protein
VKRAHRLVLAGVKLGGQVRRVGQTTIPLSCQGIPDAGGRDRLHWVEGCRALAATVSCGQDIAGDGAFSLAMIADYIDSLTTYGAAFYRNLFWEAGMVGGAGPSRGTDGENNVRPRRCVRCRTSEALPLCLYCRRVALSQLPSRDALQPGSSPRVRISRSCHQGGPL